MVQGKNNVKKVIVVGLDGFEPKLVESMLNSGSLPNLGKLRDQGGFSRVQTTYPAQTPVAWSTLATGTNPGGHGIFDFIRRDPKTYLPDLSMNRYEQRSAFLPPKAVNLRRGKPFWDILAAAGLSSTIVRFPCTYPPDNVRGRMLAGMGVPDLRGGLGTSTFYTSDEEVRPRESENVVAVRPDGRGLIKTHLIGARNPKTGDDLKFEISVQIDQEARKVTIFSGGQPNTIELKEGEWSGWLKVKFKVGMLQSVRGMVRFHLVQVSPVFELYVSPVNFDPDTPLFPISSPPEYARELARSVGTFYTTGMVEDHGGLNNERIDEAAYMSQCEDVLREREQMMLHELDRMDEGFFFCLFDTPDRVQHMFWRFGDEGHPANREPVRPEMKRVVEDHYRDCDAVVGRAMDYVDDQTLLIVLSDHGMNSFQRGVHLNSWLYENGLLVLKDGCRPEDGHGDFFPNVDWGRSKAYALGLSGIYLNIKGREEQGVVSEDEAETLKASLAKGLCGLTDPVKGRKPIRSVKSREEIYNGAYASESPDLVVNFDEGYRVSWSTSLGGIPVGQFEDNVKKWAGDHIIDPLLVPGSLFMNQKFNGAKARLLDMAPTILDAFGISKEESMEGETLLV
ncbi:MAG: alkaline phosphatase family protein [Pyrinomonadaceae bacterium]